MPIVTLSTIVTALAARTGFSEASIYERIDARQDSGMFRAVGLTGPEWALLVYALAQEGHHLGWAMMRADEIAFVLGQRATLEQER